MAEANYDKSWRALLSHEKGFVNDPNDRGGPTKYGVRQRTLSTYRGKPASIRDVEDLTEAEASQIGRSLYWNKVRGDELPSGLDNAMLEIGYHSGPENAVKMLQKCVNVPIDGRFGANTLATVQAANSADVRKCLYTARAEAMKGYKTYAQHGKGWLSRNKLSEKQSEDISLGREPRMKDDVQQPTQAAFFPLPPPRPELLGLSPSEVQKRFEKNPNRGLLYNWPLQGPRMQFSPENKLLAPSPDRFEGETLRRRTEPVPLPPRRPEFLGATQKGALLNQGPEQEAPYTPLDDDEPEWFPPAQYAGLSAIEANERPIPDRDEDSSSLRLKRIGDALATMARYRFD